MSKTRQYRIWKLMHSRCSNEKNNQYQNYGGRGVLVCERWKSFALFFADMGGSYVDGLTIERKDNDGNYEPANCRWATQKEQQNHRRNNHMITWEGLTMTLAQWCDRLGLKYDNTKQRLRLGWSVDKAFMAPSPPWGCRCTYGE
jgi:hypothetical protein